jgi:hypothetical protein
MNEKPKKKTKIVGLIAVIVLLGILLAIIIPFTCEFHSDALWIKSFIFYTEDTEPNSLGDWIDLYKHTANSLYDTKFKTSYNTDIEKYTKPAWEYILGKNQNINDNYHADLQFRDNGWSVKFDILVDGNVAKVTLNMLTQDFVEPEDSWHSGKWITSFEKQYEYYMVLEDNVVASYYQNENGQWLKTTRKPIAVGCVAFDLEGILKSVSELGAYDIPSNDPGANHPLYPDEYGLVGMSAKTKNWIYDPGEYGFEDMHDVIFANFSNYPDYNHKLSGIFRNPFHISQFVKEETAWAGRDAFLDWLCEINNTFTTVSIRVVEEDYGNVKIELPNGIENAELVDDFQFMTIDFKAALIAHFEKLEKSE